MHACGTVRSEQQAKRRQADVALRCVCVCVVALPIDVALRCAWQGGWHRG